MARTVSEVREDMASQLEFLARQVRDARDAARGKELCRIVEVVAQGFNAEFTVTRPSATTTEGR